MTHHLLTITLALTGLALTAIGLNTALGGMYTLGWQFPPEVASITDPENHARHDSNARFLAGVFTGMGLFMALSAFVPKLRIVTCAFLIAVALGAIMRLFQPGYSPLADMALLPSLIAELIGAPLLAFWIKRAER